MYRVMDFANNLGFSLCTILSVCHSVITAEERAKFKGVSSNKKYVTTNTKV